MLRTITIQLLAANSETPEAVSGVLVAPVGAESAPTESERTDPRAVYVIALPKGDAHVWENGVVTLPEPFGGVYQVLKPPTAGIEANIPLKWNKKVVIGRREFLGRDTVTVYNVREDPVTFLKSVNITVLRGVYFGGRLGADASLPALRPTESATLQIPFDAQAVDAISGEPCVYAAPKAFSKSADKSGLWTLDPNSDFFAKGEVVVSSGRLQEVKETVDDVFMVRAVSANVTPPAPNGYWEVSGSKWRFTYM